MGFFSNIGKGIKKLAGNIADVNDKVWGVVNTVADPLTGGLSSQISGLVSDRIRGAGNFIGGGSSGGGGGSQPNVTTGRGGSVWSTGQIPTNTNQYMPNGQPPYSRQGSNDSNTMLWIAGAAGVLLLANAKRK